uniref:Uncharacterized protein n=1 Tax=Suricata suricatta TaxID=37032 RepID=A0A673SUH2_SURSU
ICPKKFLGFGNSTQLRSHHLCISLAPADKTLKGCGLFCFHFFEIRCCTVFSLSLFFF